MFTKAQLKQARETAARNRAARVAAGLPGLKTPLEHLKERPTPGNAIKAMCWDCQGRGADPAVTWRIGNCQILDCPLHGFRPHQRLLGKEMPAALRDAALPETG